MPRFTAEQNTPTASTFGFSALDFNKLGAAEYTLCALAVDHSGSVDPFREEMEKAIVEVVSACRRSPRADNLLLRVARFDQRIEEVHGFKLLQDCQTKDYAGCLPSGGTTALYDAAVDTIDAVTRYGKELQDRDMTVNGIVFVITDGCNCAGAMTVGEVRKSLERAVRGEMLESLVSVLIGVNVADEQVASILKQFAADAGFTQCVALGDASERTLAKLAAFVSRSISSQSQSLSSGGPSQALSF